MKSICRVVSGVALLAAATLLPMTAEAQQEPRAERPPVPRQSRGWFGFAYSPVRAEGATARSVAVVQVEPASGAARGGLQVGDTIVRWGDRADIVAAIGSRRVTPGQSVNVRVRRSGRERDVTMVAGERPRGALTFGGENGRVIVMDPRAFAREAHMLADSIRPDLERFGVFADSLHRQLRVILRDSLGPQLRQLEAMQGRMFEIEGDSIRGFGPVIFDLEAGMRGVAGAEFTELNAELSSYFGVDRGVLVLRVAPDTPAGRSGLQAGDVVRRANGQNVERVRDLRSAIRSASNRSAELEVVRRGNSRTVRLNWN